jgi:hypothetical protein
MLRKQETKTILPIPRRGGERRLGLGTKFTALGLLVMPITGCGRPLPETAKVAGHVTLDGQPVTQGTIMFIPELGRPATGTIGPEGYELTTFEPGDGAILGRHTDTIAATETVGGDIPASFADEIKSKGQRAGELRYLIPRKYSDRATSGLTAEIKAQPEPNKINFDLTTDKQLVRHQQSSR